MFSSRQPLSLSAPSANQSGGPQAGGRGPMLIGGLVAAAAAGLIGFQLTKKIDGTTQAPADLKPGSGDTAASGTAPQQVGAATDGPVQLNLWDQEEAENAAVIDSWIEKFQTQNPNIKVARQTYPNEDLRTKFTTAATAGQAAELVWGPNDIAGVFATAKIIQSVEGIVDTAKFAPAALEAAKLEGKIMAMPATYGNHLMLIYNTSLIQSAPKTTDELIEVAKKHTNIAEKKYGLVFFQNEPFWLAPIMGGFGAWPLAVGADGQTSISLSHNGTTKALAFVKDLKYTHKVIPAECDYDCAKGLFLEEKAAMTINGDWSVKEFRQKLGDKVAVAALPVVSETNQPMTPMVSGRYLFVNANMAPEKADAVKKFLAFLSSKEVQIEVATRLGRIPATLEAQQDAQVTVLPQIKALMDTAANGKAMPAQSEMRAAWDAMRPLQQKVMAGELQPAEASKLMQDSAVEKLASIKK